MKIYLSILLVFCVTFRVNAQEKTIFSVTSGKVVFQSDAPNELINASSDQLIGLLDVAKKTFAFKVPIKSFMGFNSPLQKEHFNENYLESNQYPEAAFSGKIIEDIDFSEDGKFTVRAKGNLIVHGIKQERIIKSDVEVKGNKIFIKSFFTVALNDHDIPIPKVVKDKLSNIINVNISCQLEPR